MALNISIPQQILKIKFIYYNGRIACKEVIEISPGILEDIQYSSSSIPVKQASPKPNPVKEAPSASKENGKLPEPNFAIDMIISAGQYAIENSEFKNAGKIAKGVEGVGILLDAPGVYNNTNSYLNGEMSGFEYGYEWGKTLAPYAAGYTLGGAAGVMAGPAVWTFDWAVNTLNNICTELDAWGRSIPQKMFKP